MGPMGPTTGRGRPQLLEENESLGLAHSPARGQSESFRGLSSREKRRLRFRQTCPISAKMPGSATLHAAICPVVGRTYTRRRFEQHRRTAAAGRPRHTIARHCRNRGLRQARLRQELARDFKNKAGSFALRCKRIKRSLHARLGASCSGCCLLAEGCPAHAVAMTAGRWMLQKFILA